MELRTAYPNELYHYGIKGMKKGVRRFQDRKGDYTAEGRQRYLIDKKQQVMKREPIGSGRVGSGEMRPIAPPRPGDAIDEERLKNAESTRDGYRLLPIMSKEGMGYAVVDPDGIAVANVKSRAEANAKVKESRRGVHQRAKRTAMTWAHHNGRDKLTI